MFTASPMLQDVFPLRDAMDRLLNESFVTGPHRNLWSRSERSETYWPVPLDVYATEDQVTIVAAIPGARPEDVEVTVNRMTVTVSGQISEGRQPGQTNGTTWYLRELWQGRFQRSVTLPFEVEASQAQATFAHGMLMIELPKAEHIRARKIEIRHTETPASIAAEAGASPA